MSAPTPSQRLGPYELIALIGKGGMGEVWKARDTRLNRDVAIKFCFEQFSERFQREAHAIAALNHPHICQLYDIGSINSIPDSARVSGGQDAASPRFWLVMELIEGPTLDDRIAEGPIPRKEALIIAKQIAEALDAAHDKGIVHRDLKPGNFKLRADGSVKVFDFGLAKTTVPEPVVTHDSPTLLHAPTGVLRLGWNGSSRSASQQPGPRARWKHSPVFKRRWGRSAFSEFRSILPFVNRSTDLLGSLLLLSLQLA